MQRPPGRSGCVLRERRAAQTGPAGQAQIAISFFHDACLLVGVIGRLKGVLAGFAGADAATTCSSEVMKYLPSPIFRCEPSLRWLR